MNIGQFVHLSVDDVIWSFQWIYENKPQSIFEEPMLKKLKEWNETYNLNCDLYVFEECPNFRLEWLQDCYWEELKKESGWLKLAWHEEVAADSNEESNSLASLERTYNLIVSKAGISSWATVIRLHMWFARKSVIERLKQKNVVALLTSNVNKRSYQLMADDMKTLEEEGILYKEGMLYRKTNARLDEFYDGVSVEQMLERVQESFRKYPKEQCAEIFFHEWQFDKIATEMDCFWKRFDEIQIPLLVSAAVQVEQDIYFTTCNTDALYKLNVENKEISYVTALPVSEMLRPKFVSLIYYNEEIWMIPWYEEQIFVYHIGEQQLSYYPAPFLLKEKIGTPKFRRAIQDGSNVWLLPYRTNRIIKIDMESRTAEKYVEWESEEEIESILNFRMMTQNGQKLYLFRHDYPTNMVVDLSTAKVSTWNTALPKCFGEFLDENTVLCAPEKKGDLLKSINLESGKIEEYHLPDWIWQKEQLLYSFWYMYMVQDKVYILPAESNGIVVYNIETKEIETIDCQIEEYCSCYVKKALLLDEPIVYNKQKYVFQRQGDTVFILSEEDKLQETIRLFWSVAKQPRETYLQYAAETSQNSISKLVYQILRIKRCDWTYQDNTGEKNGGKIIYSGTK